MLVAKRLRHLDTHDTTMTRERGSGLIPVKGTQRRETGAMRGLKGKTAIVTGGAAGIGAAIVERFSDEGTRVEIFDLNASPALDITDHAAVQSAVARVGPVDILVNNAGWDMFRPFLKTDPAFWQKIISINLVGPINVLHCVLPGMVERGAARW